jgi:hypothetical protein
MILVHFFSVYGTHHENAGSSAIPCATADGILGQLYWVGLLQIGQSFPRGSSILPLDADLPALRRLSFVSDLVAFDEIVALRNCLIRPCEHIKINQASLFAAEI